jgi:ubiquitin-protein ligase
MLEHLQHSRHAYGIGGTWQSSLTIKHIVLALQTLLDEPTSFAAGRDNVYTLYTKDRDKYNMRVKEQVAHLKE